MKRFIPIPGDLIVVEKSQWYALKDGERLRVCENVEWIEHGEEIYVAPRHQVSTFWGPEHGPPDGYLPIVMSTSGGPFKTVRIKDLEGLELIGEEEDTFWCWEGWPRADGGVDRKVTVAVWRVKLLPDAHYQELQAYGLKPSGNEDERQKANEAAILEISSGSIRLGCKGCDRMDFDYCPALPHDWKDVELNLKQGDGDWETHIGLCPDCQAEDVELSRFTETEAYEQCVDLGLAEGVHPIIRQIIDRDCHVGTPTHEVVRHVISKLRDGYASYRSMLPRERAMLVAQSAMHHRGNFKLYVEVMSGFSRKVREGTAKFPSTLTGKEIVSLMRKHGTKIRSLAYRLGTTMKRIREVRAKGLNCPLAIRDWIQAITGDDPGPIPESIRISIEHQEPKCEFCGLPLIVNDSAYRYVGEVYCSVTCCRTSRGW
jgi:hypothetical protein